MEDGEHQIAPAIQQYNMPADHNVGAVGRWWRQLSFHFRWNRLDALLQAGRQRAAFLELLFESGRQAVLLV